MKVCLFTRRYSEVLVRLAKILELNEFLVVNVSEDDALRTICENIGIRYVYFTSWKNVEKEVTCFDLLISYKMNLIIPMNIVGLFRFGGINIHPSLLPKYRGLNPWFQIYYNMDLESGVTIHKITEKFDSGNIIASSPLTIELGQQLYSVMKNADTVAANLITDVITDGLFLSTGESQEIIQSEEIIIDPEIIKKFPLIRLWHILRGFPSLIITLFPELPHRFFEVVGYKLCSKDNVVLSYATYSDNNWNIVCKDGIISLCDFSKIPTIKDYIEAIAKRKFFNDKFQNVSFELNKCGTLLYAFGSEAIVFFAEIDCKKVAIRFPRNITSEKSDNYIARLKTVNRYLIKNHISNFVEFEVVPDAIELSKGIYPAMIMKLCCGDNLMSYLKKNIDKTQNLRLLLRKFIEICKTNNNFKIIHTDIHSDNIIIDEKGNIKVLDIDAIRIPPFEQIRGTGGNKNWQHPLRKKTKYINDKIDNFSEIMVCATIFVAIFAPNILYKFSDKYSLFRQKDYISPNKSLLLCELEQNVQCNLLRELLINLCSLKSLDEIPEIETISIFKI